MNKSYYIVGIKHCGKSTVGLELSKKMNIPFYDLDLLIEDTVKMSVREYYKTQGKDAFQQAETNAIKTLQTYNGNFICATGGGICDNRESYNLLKTLNNSIYINTSFETVYKRIINNGIPPFLQTKDPEAEFKELYIRRNSMYKDIAFIETKGDNMSPLEITEKIVSMIKEPQIARK